MKMRVCPGKLTAAALPALCSLLLCSPVLCGAGLHAQEAAPRHAFVRVVVGNQLPGPISGRLLVFARKAGAGSKDEQPEGGQKKVDISESHPTETSVAAVEIHDVAPGSAVEVDLDRTAFPAAFSTMPQADYELQAVIDSDHNYNYGGRDAEDWQSAVVEAKGWEPGAGSVPVLTLSEH